MDTIWLIVTVIVALLIGCIVTWLVMRKKSVDSREQTMDDCDNIPTVDIESLERQLNNALKSKAEAESNRAELETQLHGLEGRLNDKEKELSEAKSFLNDLKELPADAKEKAIIDLLKKDLKKKSEAVEEKENEIEELEDEISSIKKKLKSAKSETEELSERIEASEKKVKGLQRDLQDTESELSDLKVEDGIKSEAIEFVNAILQAKEADDRDAKTIKEKVDNIKRIVFDQYIPLQRQYYKKEDNIDEWLDEVKTIVLHWANIQRKSWLKRKKVIAFIGEFSAGKTSIVNRILSQDNPECPRLPVSSKATTAIATYISYGQGFNSQFTDANGNLKNLPTEMFTKVNKDILAKVNVSSIIQYFVMKYNNENLHGLSLLDTPGFSSNDDQDKDRTLAVINEADALFWVMDANSGEINRTSLKIIAENIKDVPLYIIINKADTKSPTELDELEKHIKQTMDRAEINVSGYVRFSQKAPLQNIMSMIEKLPEARTGLDICRICDDLQRELYELQQVLNAQKKYLRQQKNLLENREEILTEDIDIIVENCSVIANIPQYNSKWFSKDDYRMDQGEYAELTNLCEVAKEASSQAKECFDDYKSFIDEYHRISNIQSDIKEQFNAIKKVHSQLMNAINSLDPALHKEIETSVNEVLEEYKKQKCSKKNADDTMHNQNSCSKSTSDSSSRQSSISYKQDLEKAEDLEKADFFYNSGKIEEAKFWYRKAARQGNKHAQKMCGQLGIAY